MHCRWLARLGLRPTGSQRRTEYAPDDTATTHLPLAKIACATNLRCVRKFQSGSAQTRLNGKADRGTPTVGLHGFGNNPAEGYDTGNGVRGMSGDRIIHEIRTMAASVDTKLDALTAKIDTQSDTLTAKIDTEMSATNGKLDRLTAKIDSLRRMVIVVIAQVALLFVLGFLALIRSAEPGADPCLHVESPQALVQPETPAADPLVPTGDPAKALADSCPDQPTAGRESRHGLGGPPSEDLHECPAMARTAKSNPRVHLSMQAPTRTEHLCRSVRVRHRPTQSRWLRITHRIRVGATRVGTLGRTLAPTAIRQ